MTQNSFTILLLFLVLVKFVVNSFAFPVEGPEMGQSHVYSEVGDALVSGREWVGVGVVQEPVFSLFVFFVPPRALFLSGAFGHLHGPKNA